jgi:hypothetical protein
VGIPRQVASGVPEGKGMVALADGEGRRVGVRDAPSWPIAGGIRVASPVSADGVPAMDCAVPAGAEPVGPVGCLEAERVQAERRNRAMSERGKRRRSVMAQVGVMAEPPTVHLSRPIADPALR